VADLRSFVSSEKYHGKEQQMQRFFNPAAMAAVSIFAGLVAAPPSKAAVSLTAASSASAFDLSLNIDGEKQTLGNQVYARGSAPPAYNSKTSLPSYSKTYAGPAASSVSASAGSVTSTASSVGPVSGSITSVGNFSAGTFHTAVNTPLGALLTVIASNVVSRSSFTKTRAGKVTPKGSANFGKLTISGPLLGIPTKSFSGAPKVNQVLFQSPDKSVTVYLNRQVTTGPASKPTSISVDALAVVVDNKSIPETALSADIVVGATMAN
jgi:hypothetical protein